MHQLREFLHLRSFLDFALLSLFLTKLRNIRFRNNDKIVRINCIWNYQKDFRLQLHNLEKERQDNPQRRASWGASGQIKRVTILVPLWSMLFYMSFSQPFGEYCVPLWAEMVALKSCI